MKNKLKLRDMLHKFYNKIMKIKLIKALLGVVTIILSYSIIRNFIKFNKIIIYLFGLLFVGINWSDYHLLKEMKLIYDSIVLYILSYFPKNIMTDEIKDSTRKDITEIINYKDHTNVPNINGEVSQDSVYVIADRLPEVKSIRTELKESIITDGANKSWTVTEILSNPFVIFAIISAIAITGTIIVYHYDLTLDQVTTYTWTHIKASCAAIGTFVVKFTKFIFNINYDDDDDRTPRPPTNPDLPVNPALNLDKGKRPMVTLKDNISPAAPYGLGKATKVKKSLKLHLIQKSKQD
jgi:hypothetical protein